MEANPFLGLVFHSLGGLAAASFYIPYKRVRGWSWENYWLVGGVFSWILAPIIFALAIEPKTFSILAAASGTDLFWTWFFGVLWGIGGLTFGLTMRYLGIALGYAIALGLCAVFGTLIPPIFKGEMGGIVSSTSGQITLLGILVCVVGIVLNAVAGMRKERELSGEQKQESVREFNFLKGMIIAVFAGVMSASMNFGLTAGKPIAALSLDANVPELWQNLPVLVVVLFGGFVTNFVWCMYLILKAGTFRHFFKKPLGEQRTSLTVNYLFCALAGVTWYLQFFFMSMGMTQMGEYDFSSWTLHMASIIIFSTLWGLALKEWKGVSRKTRFWVIWGLGVLIISMIVIGVGNYLKAQGATV